MTYDATRIVENRRQFDEKVAEIESNEDLSERGKEKVRQAARQEHATKHEEIWTELDEADAHEVERLHKANYRLCYPASCVTPLDKERYQESIRNTRLSLANMDDGQLETQMNRALQEGTDKTLLQSLYLEALHRSENEGSFNQALGVAGGPAYRAAEAYRNTNPDARKRYQNWQQAKEQRDSPAGIVARGLMRAHGPKKEPGDTQGDAAEFLSDLFGKA